MCAKANHDSVIIHPWGMPEIAQDTHTAIEKRKHEEEIDSRHYVMSFGQHENKITYLCGLWVFHIWVETLRQLLKTVKSGSRRMLWIA